MSARRQSWAARPALHAVRAVVAIAVAVPLLGCSSQKSQVYEGYKCSKVAVMLGDNQRAMVVSRKLAPLLKEVTEGIDTSQYMMSLSEKFTDDLELHRLSPTGAELLLREIYASSTCQKLFN